MPKEIFKNKGSYLENKVDEEICIYFTTRNGGVSKAPFDTNNMAYQVGDQKEDVFENRRNFSKEIGVDLNDFVFANQNHGINIARIESKHLGQGLYSFEEGIAATDVLYTFDKDTALACFFADCTPIFFYDKSTGLIGIIHAGWQGTVKDIVLHTLNKLKDVEDVDVGQLKFVFGPSIKKESFIVQEDVKDLFVDKEFAKGCIEDNNDGTWNIDLVKYNVNIMKSFGIDTSNIDITNIDTYTASNMFSFRRENETGRMIGVIVR